MHCSLLGPLQVRVDGQPVEIGGARLRALLARLALEPGQSVSADALVDALWGSTPPAGAANALQSLVSRLRRSLGDRDLLSSTPAGYRLTVQGTDVADFERLLGEGRAALRDGDPRRARTALSEGLSLWRGQPLPDLPFVPAAVRRLEELRLAGIEDRLDADLALDRHAEIIAELDQLVATHPLRERLRGQQMTALCRAGRQADALASYESARGLLADELGVDPSPQLQAIHLAALRGDLARPGEAGTNLRTQVTSFVGRDADIAAIAGLLAERRLVTLVGAGGAGKTRLASEVGATLLDRMPDGVWLVELAPLTDPAAVPQATLSALGLRERSLLDAARDGRDVLSRLVAALTGKRLLLVLDNCEHLIEPAAALVDALLARCPQLRVLATSREPLAIAGETLHPVLPLTIDDEAAPAVRLFAERAVAVRPDFRLAEWGETVPEICRRLDGMPLAIELAAARLRALTPDELAARLDDRFRLLTGGNRAGLPRHQTLRAVVDWSWELLEKPERVLARRLALFPGGITLEAAEAVCAGDDLPADDVVAHLAALVDKSLLQEVGGGHYRMLETIRAYGQEHLATAGELRAVGAAHARYFLELAETAEPYLWTSDQLEWLHRLVAEHDNMLATLRFFADTTDAAGAVRLAAALTWSWSLSGNRAEAATWLAQATSIPGDSPPLAAALAHGGLAMIQASTGKLVEAKWSMARALLLAHRHPEIADHHPLMGPFSAIAAMAARRPAEVIDAAIRDAMQHRHPWTRATARMMLGHSAENQGRAADSEQHFLLALAEFHELGERWGLATTLESLTGVRRVRGDLTAALELQTEAIGLLRDLESYEDVAQALTQVASIQSRLGDFDEARATVEQAREIARRYGNPETRLFAEWAAGEVARRSGDLVEARRCAEAALERARSVSLMPDQLQSFFLSGLGFVEVAEGRVEEAREHFREAIRQAVGSEDRAIAADAVDGFAGLAHKRGDLRETARLLGMAEATRGLPDLGNPDVVAMIEQARTVLGAEYETAYAGGREAGYPAVLALMESGPAPVGADGQ